MYMNIIISSLSLLLLLLLVLHPHHYACMCVCVARTILSPLRSFFQIDKEMISLSRAHSLDLRGGGRME